jgi:uncharacterized PurR-regulated membrane protein YhhQ (DUF165 family)
MAGLIFAGGALSWVLDAGAGIIAIASTAAFVAAGVADTLAYRILGDRAKRLRVNGSNVISAAVDSLVFPTIAFGVFMPVIVLGQWFAKVAGGFIWSEVIDALSDRATRARSSVRQHTEQQPRPEAGEDVGSR